MTAFWEGALAGYGIAIPVGAIAVLIVEVGLRRGFTLAFMAGAGAATADLVYAGLATLAGEMLAAVLEPYAASLRLISGMVLMGMGGFGLYRVWRSTIHGRGKTPQAKSKLQVYSQFLALTLINPFTVIYFSALILGSRVGQEPAAAERVVFVIGAGLASLSWQSFLAAVGAYAQKIFTPRFRVWASLTGNLVVILIGLRVLLF